MRYQKAVIMGGGIAGLLTARVLSDHFAEVTVIERDNYPDHPDWRAGVPQDKHFHTLLTKGQQLIEQLYPGIDDEWDNANIPLYTWGLHTHVHTIGGVLGKVNTDVYGRGLSRTYLEHTLRCRTQQLTNVRFITHTNVTGLIIDGNIVTGCQVENRKTGETQAYHADLVIDASGRYSKTVEWLSDMGYAPPPQTTIDPHMGYATRWYHLPDGVALDPPAALIQTGIVPGLYRGAAMVVLEDRQVVVTLAGMNKDYPPTDEDGFLEFARSLPDPIAIEWIDQLEPVSPIAGYRASNRLRHFHKAKHYPERLLFVGDVVSSLNPIYGQGMTVALMHVHTLKDLLDKSSSLDGLALRFHRKLARVNLIPWLTAVSEDRRYPLTEGPPLNLFDRMAFAYLRLLFRATPYDDAISRALLRTMHMIQHPIMLGHPRLLVGIVRMIVQRLFKGRRINRV